MRSERAAQQRLAPRGSFGTRGGRAAASTRALAAGLVVVGSLTALAVVDSTAASASTLNGIASIANPATLAVDTTGASTTQFTVTLPPQADCSGDTATHGYHVYSYLVPKGTIVSSLTFESYPSSGYGFVDDIGTYYGPVNTAIGTGQIVSVPGDFEWAPLVANDGIPLSTLLYTGSGSTASGVWEAGLACASSNGVLSDNWNTEVTFSASATDPNGFVWSSVPGPSGSSPAAFTSAGTTTFVDGTAGSFTPTTSGSPTPVVTESGTLPTGVTFAGGGFSGTPTVTGTFPVTLTATNGIETPATQHFTLVVLPAAPTVTGVSPATGPLAGGNSVVISGANLGSATAVDFGGTPATVTADSASSITATAPAESIGTVDVTVTTAGGTSVTSPADQYTYGLGPSVSSVAPASGPLSGGTSVVISGANLGSATAVDFGGTPATVTADSASSITATAPPGATGTVDVTVTTPDGTSATSAGDQFTYVPAPTVSGVSPASGPLSGSTGVVISGTDLGSATAVDFGGTAATVTADTGTSITATAPAGSVGTVDVTVTTVGGTSATSTADQFTYVAAPAVSGVSPALGPDSGGTVVTISGTDLGSATAVDFGGTPATVTADTGSSITATAPAGSVGTVDVTVTTVGGTSATSSADQFTYGTAPAFTSAASTTFVDGVAGTFTPAASGSPTPTITESGDLPAGVTFSDGVLSGTPTVTGPFTVTLSASNGIGGPVTQSFTLNVVAIEITTTSLPAATVGATYSASLAQSSALTPVKWTVSPKLPKGLKLNKTTGAITGKVSKKATTGSVSVTFTVTYKAKKVVDTATQTITLQVDP